MKLSSSDRKALVKLGSKLRKILAEEGLTAALRDVSEIDFESTFSPNRGNTVVWRLSSVDRGARWGKGVAQRYGLERTGNGQNSEWAYVSVATPDPDVLRRFVKAIEKKSPEVKVVPNNPFILDRAPYQDH